MFFFNVQCFTFYLGLWLHKSGALGASPDGLVVCPPPSSILCHYESEHARFTQPQIIEVKCPYSTREMTVFEATLSGSKNWFLGNTLSLEVFSFTKTTVCKVYLLNEFYYTKFMLFLDYDTI